MALALARSIPSLARLLAPLLLLAACLRTATCSFDPLLIPWHHPPEYRPASHAFVNNVPALIEHQLKDAYRARVLTLFAPGAIDFKIGGHWGENMLGLLNAVATVILLGKQLSYIVAPLRPDALDTCLHLRLPCANFTQYSHLQYPPKYATWGKVAVARDVLRMLPNDTYLHITDSDVVYMKPIAPAVERFFVRATKGYAELSCMREEGPILGEGGQLAGAFIMNTGVMFVRGTPNVLALYDAWAAAATKEVHDQDGLVTLQLKHWALCSTPHMCRVIAELGKVAAVARHNEPGYMEGTGVEHGLPQCPPCVWVDSAQLDHAGRKSKSCTYNRNHCSVPQRLYFHAICDGAKTEILKGLGMWFINEHDNTLPVNLTAISELGLPCAAPQDEVDLQLVA